MTKIVSLFLALLLLVPRAEAANLKRAEFTRVINDVRMLAPTRQPVTAKIGDTISGQTAVSTGTASRAELRFPDRTLTRIGANSVFKLDQADRTVNLEKGVMLLQVPKQLGGAKVRTAAVTAAVTGTTVMFEYNPSGTIKIIVLEGEVDVYLNDNPAETRTLVAGDILIMNVHSKAIPMPGKVDLERLKRTSKLMDVAEFGPLGNQRHLADAQGEQGKLLRKGELLRSAFEIVGRGTQVTLTNEARMEIFKNIVLAGAGGGSVGSRIEGDRTFAELGGDFTGATGNVYAAALGRTESASTTNARSTGTGASTSTSGTTSSSSSGTNAGGSSNVSNSSTTGSLANAVSVSVSTTLGGGFPLDLIFAARRGTTVFGTGSSIVTNPHATAFNSVANAITTMDGVIYTPGVSGLTSRFNLHINGVSEIHAEVDDFLASRGSWFLFKSDALYLSGDIAVNSTTGPRNLILAATGDVIFSSVTPFAGVATGASWTLPLSVDALLISSKSGSISMDSSFALNGSAIVQDVFFHTYGATSDVRITGSALAPGSPASGIHLPDGTFKAFASQDVITDAGTIEAREVKLSAKRDVRIDNNSRIKAKALTQIEALGKIQVQNSSQLVALSAVDPLSLVLKATNGNVEITNAAVDATSVDVATTRGGVSIVGSSITADLIKARVLSTGGELLVSNSVLGRSTPVAGSLIKLYGEGASGVRFSGDNTLNATAVDIAGRSVTIDAGGVVRLSHPANTRVFSDTANFNNSGVNGNFTNKAGTPVSVTKDIYDHRPAY